MQRRDNMIVFSEAERTLFRLPSESDVDTALCLAEYQYSNARFLAELITFIEGTTGYEGVAIYSQLRNEKTEELAHITNFVLGMVALCGNEVADSLVFSL